MIEYRIMTKSLSCLFQVSDGVHEASYTLEVTVQQTSESGLIFSELQYTGLVEENKTAEQTILIVQPLNLRKIHQSSII